MSIILKCIFMLMIDYKAENKNYDSKWFLNSIIGLDWKMTTLKNRIKYHPSKYVNGNQSTMLWIRHFKLCLPILVLLVWDELMNIYIKSAQTMNFNASEELWKFPIDKKDDNIFYFIFKFVNSKILP